MANVRTAPGVSHQITQRNIPVGVDVTFLVELDQEGRNRDDAKLHPHLRIGTFELLTRKRRQGGGTCGEGLEFAPVKLYRRL